MKTIVFLCFVFLAWGVYWSIKRKYLPAEKPTETPKETTTTRKWWSIQVPQPIKNFDIAGLFVRAIALGAIEVLVYHFDPMGLWTMLANNLGQGGQSTLLVLNAILVTSIVFASFPKGEKGKDKAVHGVAKWLLRLVIIAVLVMLFREKLPEITKPSTQGGYSPVTLTCVPGEWSQTYTIKTRNICWDTTEDVYWVRVNNDPRMEYKGEPGKNVSIPPTPRVRTVQFRCDDKPMEVKITERP